MGTNEDMMTDVAVIGGGLAGLTAAALLADGGRRVVLFERTATLGGRAQTAQREAFALNLGPHALYVSGAAARVLEDLGVPTAGAQPPDGGVLTRGGEAWPIPTTALDLLRHPLLPLRGRLQGLRFFAAVGRGPLPPAQLDFDAWLRQRHTVPELAALARAFVRLSTYCAETDQISAAVAVGQLRQAMAGVRYVHGGWGRLVDALGRRVERAGVNIRLGCAVQRIVPEASSVRVFTAGGEYFSARDVIVATPPGAATELLGSSASPTLKAFAARARPMLAACLDVGLTQLPRPETGFALALDAPRYMACHSVADDLAPSGATLLQLAHYGPAPGDAREGLESWLDTLQPGWRDAVVMTRWLPTARVCDALPTAAEGGFEGRPAVEAAGPAAVHLCGDWVGPTGLLSDASLASAEAAAGRVLAGVEAKARA